MLQARRAEVFLYLLAVTLLKDVLYLNLYVSYNLTLASYISELKEGVNLLSSFFSGFTFRGCLFFCCMYCLSRTSQLISAVWVLLCLTTNTKLQQNVLIRGGNNQTTLLHC